MRKWETRDLWNIASACKSATWFSEYCFFMTIVPDIFSSNIYTFRIQNRFFGENSYIFFAYV